MPEQVNSPLGEVPPGPDEPYWDAEGTIVGEWCLGDEVLGDGSEIDHAACYERHCACPCHLVNGWLS